MTPKNNLLSADLPFPRRKPVCKVNSSSLVWGEKSFSWLSWHESLPNVHVVLSKDWITEKTIVTKTVVIFYWWSTAPTVPVATRQRHIVWAPAFRWNTFQLNLGRSIGIYGNYSMVIKFSYYCWCYLMFRSYLFLFIYFNDVLYKQANIY